MSASRIIKRIAYSITIIDPGASALGDIDAMPLWSAILVCILLLIVVSLLGLAAYAHFA